MLGVPPDKMARTEMVKGGEMNYSEAHILVGELNQTRKELESLKDKVQQANNYLSGGGCGAKSVQHAAELWGRVCAALEDKPKGEHENKNMDDSS